MKNKKVKLLEAVTFNGSILQAGEDLELSEFSAKALIAEGKAEDLNAENAPESPGSDKTGKGDLTPSEDLKEPAGEELGLITKALNDKYNRDPLAEEAKAVGVEFPYDAKKGEIIEAVIKAGKAEVLLQK